MFIVWLYNFIKGVVVDKFYVSIFSESNGTHEVHREDCHLLPTEEERFFLGEFSNFYDAVKSARLVFSQSNCCYFCFEVCPAV